MRDQIYKIFRKSLLSVTIIQFLITFRDASFSPDFPASPHGLHPATLSTFRDASFLPHFPASCTHSALPTTISRRDASFSPHFPASRSAGGLLRSFSAAPPSTTHAFRRIFTFRDASFLPHFPASPHGDDLHLQETLRESAIYTSRTRLIIRLDDHCDKK